MLGIHLVPFAVCEDGYARSVLADEAGGEQGKAHATAGKVEEDVAGCAAGAGVERADVGETLGLREHVNELDLIHDPVAAREQAAPR